MELVGRLPLRTGLNDKQGFPVILVRVYVDDLGIDDWDMPMDVPLGDMRIVVVKGSESPVQSVRTKKGWTHAVNRLESSRATLEAMHRFTEKYPKGTGVTPQQCMDFIAKERGEDPVEVCEHHEIRYDHEKKEWRCEHCGSIEHRSWAPIKTSPEGVLKVDALQIEVDALEKRIAYLESSIKIQTEAIAMIQEHLVKEG